MARLEGILDHDQSVVGLMALDIAEGRRFPIFFDGQRYMAALEAYTAACFVVLFGHSPTTVALAPLVFFGLFVAGQYLFWQSVSGRATGHLAALISLVGSPMLVLWSAVPRGGYIELLAWSLPVLGIYRTVTGTDAPRLGTVRQIGWGFLLGIGYFLNPLSMIVYGTLALDWTFARHGAEVRRERRLDSRWLDGPAAPWIWGLVGTFLLVLLAICCHIEFRSPGKPPLVFLMDAIPPQWSRPLGALGVMTILGTCLWWSGVGGRVCRLLISHMGFAMGAIVSLLPFAAHDIGVKRGWVPFVESLPMWIRAPWDIAGNLGDIWGALGIFTGCDPHGARSVLQGQGVELPRAVWPGLVRGLEGASPIVVVLVAALIVAVAWRDRLAWRRFWALRGDESSPPTVFAVLGLGVTILLYLLQATNPHSATISTIRYLVPAWIFLPGLLATALQGCGGFRCRLGAAVLLGAWVLAQGNLWAELDKPSPLRPLAAELERRGVSGVVAETPVALIVANLTHGHVGAVEFRSIWPRLRDRYAGRFPPGKPVTCVVDPGLRWYLGETSAGQTVLNLGPTLRGFAERYPGKVRDLGLVDRFEVWEVDLPLSEILRPKDPDLLFRRPDSAKLEGSAPTAH